MGNALQLSSCSSCSSANMMCVNYGCSGGGFSGGGGARVVHTGTGEVIEASEGTTAAEVMMEHPNHFLICSTNTTLAPGKRFTPLASHQELLGNHVYFLVPMHKLRCRLSAQDMALLSQLSHKLKRVPAAAFTPFILPRSDYNRAPMLQAVPPAPSLMTHTRVAPVAEQTLLSSFINRTPPPASLWRPSLQTIDERPHLRSWTFREGLVMQPTFVENGSGATPRLLCLPPLCGAMLAHHSPNPFI